MLCIISWVEVWDEISRIFRGVPDVVSEAYIYWKAGYTLDNALAAAFLKRRRRSKREIAVTDLLVFSGEYHITPSQWLDWQIPSRSVIPDVHYPKFERQAIELLGAEIVAGIKEGKTQGEMADLIGACRQHVNRTIKGAREQIRVNV